MADDTLKGRLEVGYAPGMVVIDVAADSGQGIMTSICSEEDARNFIQILEECIHMAFKGKTH